ncbi:helix-turn-helix domain-containing protein [Tsukamurella tyrosinosolvens]|uniref:helix-turn-helix domain-containing protein n=1 Tax=Tsukamurella tyrosinosolvens TaxID=57704 RepID=UPI000C7F2401|nr:helix-turn-helix transcriptional regulator [Tsukamurella tyrosinosolvens]AUN39986.1 hypothetical protein ASU32_08145 [Tsukamurella tyrosinosolvens]
MTHTNFSDTVTRIAATVKAIRKSEGLTAAALSDRTAALGKRISRAVISDLETGRKQTLDVTELLVLAGALNVSPVSLVFPGPYDEAVEVVPEVRVSQFNAAQWFAGNDYWIPESPGAIPIPVFPDGLTMADAGGMWGLNMRTLASWQELEKARTARSAAVMRLVNRSDDDEQSQAERQQIQFYDGLIARLRGELGLADD